MIATERFSTHMFSTSRHIQCLLRLNLRKIPMFSDVPPRFDTHCWRGLSRTCKCIRSIVWMYFVKKQGFEKWSNVYFKKRGNLHQSLPTSHRTTVKSMNWKIRRNLNVLSASTETNVASLLSHDVRQQPVRPFQSIGVGTAVQLAERHALRVDRKRFDKFSASSGDQSSTLTNRKWR